jgi:hypothetical protein
MKDQTAWFSATYVRYILLSKVHLPSLAVILIQIFTIGPGRVSNRLTSDRILDRIQSRFDSNSINFQPAEYCHFLNFLRAFLLTL